MAATGVGSIEGTEAEGMNGGTIACEGASRAVFTEDGGTVRAVSGLDEVQPERPIHAARIADVAAEKRMRTRTQYTDPALNGPFPDAIRDFLTGSY